MKEGRLSTEKPGKAGCIPKLAFFLTILLKDQSNLFLTKPLSLLFRRYMILLLPFSQNCITASSCQATLPDLGRISVDFYVRSFCNQLLFSLLFPTFFTSAEAVLLRLNYLFASAKASARLSWISSLLCCIFKLIWKQHELDQVMSRLPVPPAVGSRGGTFWISEICTYFQRHLISQWHIFSGIFRRVYISSVIRSL